MRANMEILHVSKQYKNGVTALEDVSFCVGSGVFGLLGHNGAGKTTLMKALVTVLKPSAGTIRVCGFDTAAQGKEVRARVGYLPQELAMYPSLSVWDFVNYMAQIKGIRDKKAVSTVLEEVEMLEFSRRKIGQLSGGMKRRVGIAQALIGNPPILVVDEPTAGLDPEERVRFRGPAVAIRQRGTHGFALHAHRGGHPSALRGIGCFAEGTAVLRGHVRHPAGTGKG